jgi:SAM-dependent methyltransferase
MTPNESELTPAIPANTESLQKQHYERIGADYDVHYNDAYSQKYMRRFVFEPMFEGLNVENQMVLEAMCGGGQTTKYLLEHKAKVVGLDISPQQTTNFKRRHQQADVLCGSILSSGIESESFDMVTVIGGIHHLPPHTKESILEIHRVLKPGGHFCFMEPHSESFAERFRKAWYKRDSLFAENEAAINMSELHQHFSNHFTFKREHYLGNFAYLLVLNSMVFRVPINIKPYYSPFLISAEGVFNKILGKPFSCFVVAQWQKK